MNTRIDPSKPTPDIAQITHFYYTECLPMKAIAEEFGVSPDYIRKLLRKNGNSARSRKGLPALSTRRTRMKNLSYSDFQEQIIFGSILGDGTLTNPHRCKTNIQSALRVLHSSKQRAYLQWKHQALLPFVHPIHSMSVSDGVRTYFGTPAHPYFTELRERWYPKGKKVFLSDVPLDLVGLAVWYMDDGTLGISKGSPYGFFCTDGFGKDQQPKIQKFLSDQFDLQCSVVKATETNDRIRISAQGIKHLRDLIHPYVIPEMSYKLDF